MNPYLIEGPALISFSGGRTSAFMLRQILDAHDGVLPPDVHVCFANTGKEREETLRFVHECGVRWNVPIRWLEYRRRERGTPWKDGFTEVGYNSASRSGEPFDAVIAVKGFLPNPMTRYCTIELKVRVMKCFAKALGWDRWKNIVGLRADEMLRVFKALSANENYNDPWTSVMPMASRAANVRQDDVLEFWARQEFDLGLKTYEGNCDLCFLKSRGKQAEIIRRNPEMAAWWLEKEGLGLSEKPDGNRFRIDRSFSDIVQEVATSPLLPLEPGDEEFDAECGLWCAGEAA